MRSRFWMTLCLSLMMVVALGACRNNADDAAPGAGDTPVEGEGDVSEDPEIVPEKESASKVPADTFVNVTIGEPESLDPAWTYETSGAGIEANIYEGLVYFNREMADDFVPALAESWEASEDGLIHTFNIREGVTFHEGGTLEPHDIAYSIQRAMLQDRVDGPMWLFNEPILGTSSISGLAIETAALGEEGTLEDVPEDVAAAICEMVQTSVSADDEASWTTKPCSVRTPRTKRR